MLDCSALIVTPVGHHRQTASDGLCAPRSSTRWAHARALADARAMLRPMAREFAIEFSAGCGEDAVFRVSSRGHRMIRALTLSAGQRHVESWALPADGRYHFLVRGPRGLVREYRGCIDASGGRLYEVQLDFGSGRDGAPALCIANFGDRCGLVCISDLGTREQRIVRVACDDVLEWRPRAGAGAYNYCVTGIDQAELRWQFVGALGMESARRGPRLAG